MPPPVGSVEASDLTGLPNSYDLVDLAILRVAASLNTLCSATDVRILAGDLGMQLCAQMMELKVLHVPDVYRKRETTPTTVGHAEAFSG